MALITSATETEALNQRPLSTVAESSSKTTGDFSDVLNQAFSATSEDMDTIFEEAAKLLPTPLTQDRISWVVQNILRARWTSLAM